MDWFSLSASGILKVLVAVGADVSAEIWYNLFLYAFSYIKDIAITWPVQADQEIVQAHYKIQGLFSSFFWEQGFGKVVKVLEPSNCLKGSMCNFWKQALRLLPHLQIFPTSCVCLLIILGGKRGPE